MTRARRGSVPDPVDVRIDNQLVEEIREVARINGRSWRRWPKVFAAENKLLDTLDQLDE